MFQWQKEETIGPMQFRYNYRERRMALHVPILREKKQRHISSLKLLYLHPFIGLHFK